jgi:competence ComEA-like helix-hairpin-helix protein
MKKTRVQGNELQAFAGLFLVFSLLGCPALVRAGEETGSVEKKPTGVVNVNTADEAQLCLLPGIGPKTAQKIILSRQKRPFKKVKHLLRVKGIGRKTLKKLLPYVTVNGETTLTTSVPSS